MSRFHNTKLVTTAIKVSIEDKKAVDLRVKNFSQLMRTLLRMYLRGEINGVKCEELKTTTF